MSTISAAMPEVPKHWRLSSRRVDDVSMPRLTGKEYEALTRALLAAFPSLSKLRQLLRFKLGKNLDSIALGDDLAEIVFKLISTAEAEGWTARLVAGARE